MKPLKCVTCGYAIKRGQLFVMVMRAADEYGSEMQWDPEQGRLAMHAGPCPAVSIDEPCLD